MKPATLTLTAALLLGALLAGCADREAPTTRIAIDFPAPHPDVDAQVPAAGIATAYDQLLAWSRSSGVRVDVREFSFGHCLDAIDGLPKTPGCSAGSEAYWALAVDGEASMTGMDQTPVGPGDTVTWTYTPLEPPASNGTASTGTGAPAAPRSTPSAAPALEVAAPAPTRDATLTLAGTVDRPVRLSVAGLDPLDIPAGPWTVALPLDYGQTPVRILADDGTATTAHQVVAIRLAPARLQAEFAAAVPQRPALDDTVWLDIDAHLSAPSYDGKGIRHPPHANVHDVLVAWVQSGRAVEFSYSESFGFGVESIEGHGALSDWCYDVNGEPAPLGITGMEFRPGDAIAWHGCLVM